MRPFGYLLSSSVVSNLADGVLKAGAPLLAVTMTRNPALVSLIGVATTLPWLLLALHAGAIADRADRRRIMMLASTARAVSLGGVALLASLGVLNLWLLLVAVLLAGVAEVFSDTSAQSVLPMTVEPGDLARANGRVVSSQTIGTDFLGAPLAGLVVAAVPAAVLGLPALLFAGAALFLLGMRGSYRPATVSTAPLMSDIATGLRYLRDHRFLSRLAACAGLMNLANSAYFAVFVLYAVGPGSRMGLEPAAFAPISAVLATGAIIGSLLAGRVSAALGEGHTVLGAWLVNSLLLLVPLLAPTLWALFPVAFLLGLTNAGSNVVVISMRQRLIPTELMGRVNSAYRLIGMGGMPLGSLIGGLIGTAFGLPAVFVTTVALCLIAWALIFPQLISPRLTCETALAGISGSR
ncbi:MFS transporter [Nonomuraea soli]|uniref:MFS family permease n=1 Tax=Nonomuraea soli TaxID=1032476 RepID=A0A7W0HNN1_9ACTN|nr:MFS transporter [Nonomuraea soli]MBA2889912.1 MFS family permease [Nonomuraea soli]